MADISLSGNTRSIFRNGRHEKNDWLRLPVLEMVFFDNTYDRNKNHRLDDPLTHIAIVVGVDTDETIQMVHLGGSGNHGLGDECGTSYRA